MAYFEKVKQIISKLNVHFETWLSREFVETRPILTICYPLNYVESSAKKHGTFLSLFSSDSPSLSTRTSSIEDREIKHDGEGITQAGETNA